MYRVCVAPKAGDRGHHRDARRLRSAVDVPPSDVMQLQRLAGNRATTLSVQRALQLRPPGPREASAFARRQELVDRLNAMSGGTEYVLQGDGRTIDSRVVDASRVTSFDRRMRGFIDLPAVIPLRLITRHGYVGGQPLRMDSLQEAYVDLDDLLASSDHGLQMILTHFLTERSRVPNYERRIGTPMPEFDAAHRAGREAEAQLLQDLVGDPSIRYVYEERRDPANPATSRYVIGFRSRADRYWIFQVYANRQQHGVRASTLFVRMADGRRLTVDELIVERRRAPAPAVPAPALPGAL
jgi:hypothetical protein